MCRFAVFTEMIRVDMENRYPILHRLLYEEVVGLIWQICFISASWYISMLVDERTDLQFWILTFIFGTCQYTAASIDWWLDKNKENPTIFQLPTFPKFNSSPLTPEKLATPNRKGSSSKPSFFQGWIGKLRVCNTKCWNLFTKQLQPSSWSTQKIIRKDCLDNKPSDQNLFFWAGPFQDFSKAPENLTSAIIRHEALRKVRKDIPAWHLNVTGQHLGAWGSSTQWWTGYIAYKTYIASENGFSKKKRKVLFQPSIFRA